MEREKGRRLSALKPRLAAAALSLLVLAGCGADRGKKKTAEAAGDEAQLPEYVLRGVNHSLYEDGVLTLQVAFERGAYFAERRELAVEKCAYVYYDSEGNVLSRGRSKRATLFSDVPRLVADDDVVVVSEVNGGVLETDHLEWLGRSNQFTTNDFVTVRRLNGDMISGKGMIADLALRFVTIKRNVKGQFHENKSPSS